MCIVDSDDVYVVRCAVWKSTLFGMMHSLSLILVFVSPEAAICLRLNLCLIDASDILLSYLGIKISFLIFRLCKLTNSGPFSNCIMSPMCSIQVFPLLSTTRLQSIYTMPYRLPHQDQAAYSIAKEISFFLRAWQKRRVLAFVHPPHRYMNIFRHSCLIWFMSANRLETIPAATNSGTSVRMISWRKPLVLHLLTLAVCRNHAISPPGDWPLNGQYADMYVYTDTICSCRTPVGHCMFHILHCPLGNASRVL